MKKLSLLVVLCLTLLAFTACGKSENENDNDGTKPTEAVELTGSVTPAEDVNPTAAVTPAAEPVATDAPEITPEVTAAPDPVMADINEPIEGTEQIGVTEKAILNNVLRTYYGYITNYMSESESADFEATRYGLALIDGDRIPELLIADNNYHGTGVRVIFYNNGEPKEVGKFGSEGGFSYIKYENRIISFFMGGGVYTTDFIHVNQDFTTTTDQAFFSSDDDGCSVNGEEISYERYEEMLDEARESKLGNKRLIVEFDTLMRYYPYSNEELVMYQLIRMFQELREPEFESFPIYFNDDMRKISDNWSLIECEADTAIAAFKYDVKNDSGNKQGYKTYSEVVISEYSGVGIWLSAYKGDDSFDFMNIIEYNMPMVYYSSGQLKEKDYGWSAQAFSESEEFEWDVLLFYDEKNDHLLIQLIWPRAGETPTDHELRRAEDGKPIQDTVILTYERHFEDYSTHYVNVELTRREDYDSTRGKAFEGKEYIMVSADDTELIKQYGLPENLDGYDYEVVYPSEETFIFYIDEDTYIEVLNFEDGIQSEQETLEDFCNREYFGDYTVCFEDYNPDGDFNGMMAVSVTENYTG